mgnify:CR=1 FL=1
MTLRTLVAAIVMLLIVGINAYLLYVEETDYYAQIVVDDEGAVVMKNEDPLIALVYTRQKREENFAAYGMPESLVNSTMARIRKIEDFHKTKIEALLLDAGSVDEVVVDGLQQAAYKRLSEMRGGEAASSRARAAAPARRLGRDCGGCGWGHRRAVLLVCAFPVLWGNFAA